MEKNTYNGWSNYETWLVDVWLTNTYGLQQSIMEDMDERIVVTGDIWAVAKAVANLASCIENYIDAVVDAENISSCGVVSDLLTASLGRVNYGEIAKNWLEL